MRNVLVWSRFNAGPHRYEHNHIAIEGEPAYGIRKINGKSVPIAPAGQQSSWDSGRWTYRHAFIDTSGKVSNIVSNTEEPRWVVVKHANDNWENWWEGDPKVTGVTENHSAAYSHAGKVEGCEVFYTDKSEAQRMADKLNLSNPCGYYAVCPGLGLPKSVCL